MKYLIVGPSWVGDMVMAQSLFMLIRRRDPEARIDVLAPAWSRPIVSRMPEVTGMLDMPVGHGEVNLGVRFRLGKSLRAEKYDQAIVLPNSLKSALIPWWARIPLRTGWRGEMRYGLLNDVRVLDKQALPLMIQRFDALALPRDEALPEKLPYPRLMVDLSNQRDALQRFDLNTNRPVLALCPGAEFGEAKRWPAEHYAALAQEQIASGSQIWLFGSAKDQPVGESIIAALPESARAQVVNLAGRTSLADAVDLLALAKAVVSNDSGLMHVAAALQRPLVVLYGSTSPGFTPPLADQVSSLRLGLDCSPCFQRECPLGHMKCLKGLSPAMANQALNELLTN